MNKRVASMVLVFTIALSNVINATCFATVKDFEHAYEWNLMVYNSKPVDETAYSEFLKPTSTIQSDDPKIISLANTIVKGIDNDYGKVRAIYSWVADNIWYDWDRYEGRVARGDVSALGALSGKRSVCSGYSNLTVALCRAAKIPAIVAPGHAVRRGQVFDDSFDFSKSFRNGNHVWVESYVDGRWIIMDATWDSNNVYKHDTFSVKRASDEDFFDISLRDLTKTHVYSSNYSIEPYPVTDITLPNGLEDIVDYAFWRNASLQSITLPESVKGISKNAFGYCTSLEKVSIPDSVTYIGDYAFFRCTSLKTLAIPNSVVSIGKSAFSGCANLKSIYIPASVTKIEEYAFYDVPGVTIKGSAGSYAHKYAIANAIPFIAGAP